MSESASSTTFLREGLPLLLLRGALLPLLEAPLFGLGAALGLATAFEDFLLAGTTFTGFWNNSWYPR